MAIIEFINKIPLNVLQLIPTILFILMVLWGFLAGVRRGFRKSLILLINFIIAFTITAIAFFTIFGKDFDTRIVELVNNVMGEGYIQGQLNVSSNLNSVGEMGVEFAFDMIGDGNNPMINALITSLGGVEAYIACICEMLLRLALGIVFFIEFMVMKLILYIIYLIFLREGRRKKKIRRDFEDGMRPTPYNRGRLGGSLIGLTRGLIRGLVVLSFFGMIAFMVTGGTYNEGPIKNETEEQATPEMLAITNIYNFFKTYGTTGIGGIFEKFKDPNKVPYYLMIADMVSRGYLEDEELGIEEYVLLREEIAAFTNIANYLLEYIIKNNITIYENGALNLDFDIILESLLDDPNFESVLIDAIDKFANEKIVVNLAKHCLDSAVMAYVDSMEEPNKVLQIFFGGDDPLSLTKDILTKNNFKVVVEATFQALNLAKDLGYGLDNIKELDMTSFLSEIHLHEEKMTKVLNKFGELDFFGNPMNSKLVNKKMEQVFSHYLTSMDAKELKDVDFSFLSDISFVDTFDEDGNLVNQGEIRNLLAIAPTIIKSQLISKFDSGGITDNLNEIVDILLEEDEEQETIISKLLTSNLVYFTISSIIDDMPLDEEGTIKLYAPKRVKVEVNGRHYISKPELINTINLLARILKEVNLSEITSDPMAILNVSEETLLALLDSYLIQGTLAYALTSDMEQIKEFINIPTHLQFRKEDGEIDETVLDLWFDKEQTRTKAKGEVRKTIEGILDLGLLDMLTGKIDQESLDLGGFLSISQDQIIKSLSSDVLRFTVDKLITEQLNKEESQDVNVIIPLVAKEASSYPNANPNDMALSANQFYLLLNAFKIVFQYEENEPFYINELDFENLQYDIIANEKEDILASLILYATIIQMLYDTSLTEEGLYIPQDFSYDLIKDENEGSRLVTDFYNTHWVKTKEVFRMLDAILILDISDFKNINIDDKLEDLLSDEDKMVSLLDSYIIEYTMMHTLYTQFDENEDIYIPMHLIIDDNNPNYSGWLANRDSNYNYSKTNELYLIVHAVVVLDLLSTTDEEESDETNEFSFEFDQSSLLNVSDEQINEACRSKIILFTISKQIFDLADNTQKDATLVVPDAAVNTNSDNEDFIIISEITLMFKAVKAIIPEGSDLENLSIDINQIVSDDSVKEKVVASRIVHATVIHQIVTMSNTGGDLHETVYIPLAYVESYESELKKDFDNSLWFVNNEIDRLLTGIKIIDLFEGVDTSDEEAMKDFNFDLGKIKSLNEKHDEDYTKLEKTCESDILHFTLTKQIKTQNDILVLDEVIISKSYDANNQNYIDNYINVIELEFLINSFIILDINDLEAQIDMDKIFEVSGNYQSFEEKAKDLLNSYILEATIAKQIYKNLSIEDNDSVLIIHELQIAFEADDSLKNPETNNIYNWVSQRDDKLQVVGEFKEVYRLLIAFDKLNLNTNDLESGNINIEIQDIVGGDNKDKQDALLASKLIHATVIKTIVDESTVGNLKDSVYVPEAYTEAYNDLYANDLVFENNLWVDTHEVSKLLKGIDALDMVSEAGESEGEESSDLNFDFAKLKELNDFYNGEEGPSKLDVVCDSKVLYFTLSKQISDSDEILVLDKVVVIDTIDGYELYPTNYIHKKELTNLIEAFKVLNVTQIDDIDVAEIFAGDDEKVDDNINILLESLILEATIAKQTHSSLTDENADENLLLIDELKLTFDNGILVDANNPNNNIYKWVSERDSELNVLPDGEKREVYNLLKAAHKLGIGDKLSSGHFDIEVKDIVGSDSETSDKQDQILKSKVIHASIIQTIVNKSENEGGELNGVVSIPKGYVEALNTLPSDYNENVWLQEGEVKNMLVGIGVLGIYDNESESGELSIDFTVIKNLSEQYDTNKTNFDVICESNVLYLTISNKISDNNQLVILKSVCEEIDINGYKDTYIHQTEIKNLIDCINKLGIEEFDDIDAHKLFEFVFEVDEETTNQEEKDEEVKENIMEMFGSIILESTIAFEAFNNLASKDVAESILVVDELTIPSAHIKGDKLDTSEVREDHNFYNWLFMRDGSFNIIKTETQKRELYYLLFACYKLGIIDKETKDFSAINIKLKNIVGEDNHHKQQALIDSKVIHASIIQTIVVESEDGKQLHDVIYVPQEYVEAYESLKNNGKFDNSNAWIKENEISNLLVGIEAFDLFNSEDDDTTDYNFDFKTIKKLSETYGDTQETKLEILCKSRVLHFTLSGHIINNDDLLVLPEVVETKDLGDKYVYMVELVNLVNAITIIDVNDSNSITVSKLFENTEGLSIEMKIASLLKSYIMEATIAEITSDNLSNSDATIIDKLVFMNDSGDGYNASYGKAINIYNWITTRTSSTLEIDVDTEVKALDTFKELYRLLLAINVLGIADSIEDGNVEAIGSKVFELSENQILTIMNSKVMGYTLSLKIWDVDALSKAKIAINIEEMKLDLTADAAGGILDSEMVLLKSQEVSNILRALNILLPDVDDLADDGIEINANDFFELTDEYEDTGNTKLSVVCQSDIMWLTISDNLFDQSKPTESSTTILIPNEVVSEEFSDTLIESRYTDDYLRIKEIENLLAGLKLFLGSSASFDDIQAKIPNNDDLETMLKSYILTATFSDMIKDNFELINEVVENETTSYSNNSNNITMLYKKDIKDLFKSLNIIVGDGGSLNGISFSISTDTQMTDGLKSIFGDSTSGEQLILRLKLSEQILLVYEVPEETLDYAEKAFADSYTLYDTLDKCIMLTKMEIAALINAFDVLDIDLSSKESLNVSHVIGLFTGDEEKVNKNAEVLLSSQIAWILLSDMLLEKRSITIGFATLPNTSVYEMIQMDMIVFVSNPCYNADIDSSKDHTSLNQLQLYKFAGESKITDVIHKENVIEAFTTPGLSTYIN